MKRGIWRLSLLAGVLSGGLVGASFARHKWLQPDLSNCDYLGDAAWVLASSLAGIATVLFLNWVWEGFSTSEDTEVEEDAINAGTGSIRAHAATAVFSILASVLVFSMFFSGESSQTSQSTNNISTILTALAVILTALAIFLGTVGAVGYASIRREMLVVARKEATSYLASKFPLKTPQPTENVVANAVDVVAEAADEVEELDEEEEKEDEK